MADAACLLCDKLRDPPAAEVVWEFPRSVAFLGPWQYYTGYCVLVSRTHAAELHDLPRWVRDDYMEEVAVLSRAIAAAVRPRKINLESLGNQVPHMHWHLFPRQAYDSDKLKAVWVALDRAERDPVEYERLKTSEMDPAFIIDRLQKMLRMYGAPRR